jgi:hypothetical protein
VTSWPEAKQAGTSHEAGIAGEAGVAVFIDTSGCANRDNLEEEMGVNRASGKLAPGLAALL